jgi:hypothetical protein
MNGGQIERELTAGLTSRNGVSGTIASWAGPVKESASSRKERSPRISGWRGALDHLPGVLPGL